jgi:S1-C subfamily serine protease
MRTPRPLPAAFGFAVVAFLFVPSLARADDPKPDDPKPATPAPAEKKPAERGYIGFQAVPAASMTAGARAELKVPADAGVVAVHVLPTGPAGQAGLKNGDVVVSIAGKEMPDTKALTPDDHDARDKFTAAIGAIVSTMKVGTEVEVVVRRSEGKDAKNVTLKMTPIEKSRIDTLWRAESDGAEGGLPPPAGTAPTADHGYIGLSPMPVALLSDAEKERWSVTAKGGIIATHVIAGSPATKAGLRNGDVLKQFAGEDLPMWNTQATTPVARREFKAAFAGIAAKVKVGAEVEIVVERDGKPVTLKATAIDLTAMQKLAEAAMDDGDAPEPSPGPETRPK